MQSLPTHERSRAALDPAAASGWRDWFDTQRTAVDRLLSEHLKALAAKAAPHSRLMDAVSYSLLAGGKRLRPILVLECCRVCGGASAGAEPAALALELLHTFSLIHDDLPAMDDDDLRRGRPTNHKVFGEALAILAGDWLAAHAFGLLAAAPVPADVVPRMVAALADGSEAMIAGQAADIAGEERPPDGELVRYIHRHKTAALMETACRLGALCAGAGRPEQDALASFGRHLGLAFQIVDDLLDARGAEAEVGKRVGKDAAAAKQTWPAAFGVAESVAEAEREVAAAVAALVMFGPRAQRLRELAEYVLRREQ